MLHFLYIWLSWKTSILQPGANSGSEAAVQHYLMTNNWNTCRPPDVHNQVKGFKTRNLSFPLSLSLPALHPPSYFSPRVVPTIAMPRDPRTPSRRAGSPQEAPPSEMVTVYQHLAWVCTPGWLFTTFPSFYRRHNQNRLYARPCSHSKGCVTPVSK